MPKILILHGAGMNMRGKVQLEIFGPMTLPEYDERIRGYAAELGLDVEIFHSNEEYRCRSDRTTRLEKSEPINLWQEITEIRVSIAERVGYRHV